MSEKTCCAEISNGGWSWYKCAKNAKFEREGKWYCGTHDPVRVEARRKEREDKYKSQAELERQAKEQYADVAAQLGGKAYYKTITLTIEQANALIERLNK